jgi:uncharacterized integral membrane protein
LVPDEAENDPNAVRAARASGWTLLVAFLTLIAFSAMVIFALSELDAREPRWTRLAWLFSAVEAIAFAAAGALFGSSVHRARAERAEAEARTTRKDAERGRALASVIKADDPQTDAGASRLESLGPAEAAPAAALARHHAEVARELFP